MNPPVGAAIPTGRPAFFPEGPDTLREDLADYLRTIGGAAASLPGLQALLLGGGYGRGEGGLWRTPDGELHLYNDLEFYVLADHVPPGMLREWTEEGERRFGIEMEFKVLSSRRFRSSRPSMFFYDLVCGHVLVAGESDWSAALPRAFFDAASIPPDEAARLLVNRGMSLLRCLRGGAAAPEDFTRRIVSKLHLALGDAVLCVQGRYHWSCRERHAGLARPGVIPPGWEDLLAWHAQGVEFKFHPTPQAVTAAELEALRAAWLRTFLWVESRRLGKAFHDAQEYACGRMSLFPEDPNLSNPFRQWRDARRSPRLPFSWGHHPRGRIWKALPLLLEAAGETEKAGANRALAARLLGARDRERTALEEHARACWRLYP